MRSKRTRLDRFISAKKNVSLRTVQQWLAEKRVVVDGKIAANKQLVINEFMHIEFDNQTLQKTRPYYIMLHKPKGVVSATKDHKHKTVIDLLSDPCYENLHSGLHLVGRLDFNSTGLVLLTNNGRWSRHLTSPDKKIKKRYRVTLKKPLTPEYKEAFAKGMYFDYEGITTQPAQLTIINPYIANVDLVEGRYHQIKRMFGRFDNEVLDLHRFAVGNIDLDDKLQSGASRFLTKQELAQSWD